MTSDGAIGRLVETLRTWLMAAGLWTTRRERIRKAHQPRHRRDCLGELVQIDGCQHAWFEDRGAVCSLAQEARGDVKVNAACPGWVRTRMGGSGAPKTVEQGADTIVWLATLPADGPSGGLFRNRRPIAW